MFIENIRYNILSKNNKQPEKRPLVGEVISLRIQEQFLDNNAVEDKTLTTRFVEPLGRYYVHVTGLSKENDDEVFCDAKYDVERVYPENSPIGHLILEMEVIEP